MADHLKYSNATGHLVYGANGHLVHTCEGCCDYTVTITNCPALNGSYDVTYGVAYDDGTVSITLVGTTLTIQLNADAQGTFISAIADSSFTCPDETTWTADDWDGCGGGTPGVAVACT